MRSIRVLRLLIPLLVISLFVLSVATYAAEPVQQKPAFQPSGKIPNPNAPPQGTITIVSPQSGAIWYTGSYQVIQWTCNGTRSNLTDVTLWQNNREVAIIWTDVATGHTAYIVPFGWAAGNYELRVTSKGDTRVEARLPITVATTTVTFTNPSGALLSGSSYTINWSYTGSSVSVKLVILDSSGAVVQSVPNISIGSNGKGSWSLAVPALPQGKSSAQYRFQLIGTFKVSVTSDVKADVVLGSSGLFTIQKPEPMSINCPGSTQIRKQFGAQISAIVPSGWSVVSENSGSVQYKGYTILTDTLNCKYNLDSGNSSVPFMEIKHLLPKGYTCKRSAGYGAHCDPN